MGTPAEPLNQSKGGMMRVAPVGLFFDKERAFQIACQCAALTHGDPSGYLSAGVLAYVDIYRDRTESFTNSLSSLAFSVLPSKRYALYSCSSGSTGTS